MLRESLKVVLDGYLHAKTESFTNHALAYFIKHDFPKDLSSLIGNKQSYKLTGSAGQTKWTDCPWVATLNTLITESPQRGFYVVYLFSEDMTGAYLSLNQGITDLRIAFGIQAKNILISQAAKYRSQVSPIPPRLRLTSINLAAKSSSTRSAFYQSGNICAIYYDAADIPSESVLVADYNLMLSLYERLVEQKNREEASIQLGQEGLPQNKLIEDLTNMKMHERIDRNPRLSYKVKKILGYTCQVCGFNFQNFYGPLGIGYIESHHLIPISQLKGQVISLDPSKDFAVLCSNCHRMIHKFDRPHDIQAFKTLLTA